MSKIAIIYGTSGGNTEDVAKRLQKLIGGDVFDAANVSVDDIASYDKLILGTSTTGIGDLQDDWESFLPNFLEMDFAGKTVAIFALGDSGTFSDSFVGSMNVLYEALKDKVKIVGGVADEGYTYDDSDSVRDGKWVGLPLDEENESNETDARLAAWVEIIKPDLA